MILGNIFKKFEGIDTTILLVSLSIIIVIIVLAVKNSKIEDFENEEISNNTELYSRGPAGAAGPDGEPKPNININEVYSGFKEHIMNKLVEKNIIVNDGSVDNPNYFPVGIINMKKIIDTGKKKIPHNEIKDNKYFIVNYEKKAKNSFVKISYTITLTGRNYKGNQFTIFKGKLDDSGNIINSTQISVKTAMAGVYNGTWDQIIPKSITITGIDTDKSKEKTKYFVRIEKYADDNNEGHGDIKINGVLHKDYQLKKYNNAGYLSSSCRIEEIMLPEGTNTTLSNFI